MTKKEVLIFAGFAVAVLVIGFAVFLTLTTVSISIDLPPAVATR